MKAKIKRLIDEGYEQEQAVAIAYKYCGEGDSARSNQRQEFNLHFDKIRFGGKILYQDEKITVVPAVLMAEGVQNRALKPWEEFYDPEGLEGALWLGGVPIVREHPSSYVTHLTTKIGRVRNVQPDVYGRRILAEAVLFNDRLTPEEMQKIESGEMMGGSIGYWCQDEFLDSPQIWPDSGEEYDCIQRGPFFFDHFALVADPACEVCGLNVNSANNCNCKKHSEVNDLPDDKKAAAEGQPKIDEQKPPEGDPKPPEVKIDEKKPPEGDPKPPEAKVDEKKPEAKPIEALKANALDAQTLMIKARTILEMSDDYAKAKEALAFLMEIVAEEGASAAVQGASKQSQKLVVEMDSKLIERFNVLEAKIGSQTSELKALKEDNQTLKDEKAAREAAVKAEQDEKIKAGIKALLNQNAQMDFDAKHWPEIQKDGFNVWVAEPENAKLLDIKSKEDTKITPVGQEFVPHGDDQDIAGVKTVAALTEKYYPGAKEPEKKEGK